MGPFQGKNRGIMLFNCVRRALKSVCAVTCRTIRGIILLYKLFIVIIHMAVRTKAVFYGISQCRFMAEFARNALVFIFQLEIGFAMIKIRHACDRMKGFFVVALPAILPELPFVHIRVATGAV